MNHLLWKLVGATSLCAALAVTSPVSAKAAGVKVETSTSMFAKIDAPNVVVRAGEDKDGAAITRALKGETYEVAAPEQDGWVKIHTDAGDGYIPANRATLLLKTTNKVDKNAKLRQDVVNYALQFVGNPYVYGGTNPNIGADCSGLTSYVLKQAAGITLPHNAKAQSRQGHLISLSEAKPGDLLFYGDGGDISHVGIYIGGGKIVHASTERTGIKVSSATYRQPIKVVSVLG